MSNRGTVVGLGALALLTAGALGAAITFAVTQPSSTSALQRPTAATQLEVTQESFDDARNVHVTLEHAGVGKLSSPTAGVLTRLDCIVGGTIASGSAPLSIEGNAVVALATSTPLWRDLPAGASGADVDALHAELTRLGFKVPPVAGRVDASTFVAFQGLLKKAGAADTPFITIPVARVSWIPHPTTAVSACSSAVGQPVERGATLVEFPPELVGARLPALPARLIPGPRTLQIGSVEVPLDPDGVVRSAADLVKISGTAEYAAAVRDPAQAGLSGQLVLKTPIQMSVLPASAVVSQGNDQCVFTAPDSPVGVSVVGSQLGQSYVTFKSQPPGSVQLSPPRSASCNSR